MTVLIVDDNSLVRSLLRRTISAVASPIWESADGLDGVDQYCIHRPDVVLMDLHMPRLDGLAATRRIVRLHPNARVVILTDCDDLEVRVAAQQAGACAYLPKVDLTGIENLLQAIV